MHLLPSTPITSLDAYLATEVGGAGVSNAQSIGPRATIETVAAAGLRGRGGGGFPTGRKWASIADQAGTRLGALNRFERRPALSQPIALQRGLAAAVGMVVLALAATAIAAPHVHDRGHAPTSSPDGHDHGGHDH